MGCFQPPASPRSSRDGAACPASAGGDDGAALPFERLDQDRILPGADQVVEIRSVQEGVGSQGLQLVVIAQHRQRAATLRDPALELAVLVMHGAEAEIRGPGTDPQETEVEAELFDALGRRDVDGPADQRILLATDEDGPDAGSLQQPAGDGRAVGHHRQTLVFRHEGGQ